MFSNPFSFNWKPHTLTEATGTAGSATVCLRGLPCKRHLKTGKKRFRNDLGISLYQWILSKWKEEGNNPMHMASGSPWKWRVEIRKFDSFEMDVTYHAQRPEAEMISDTLDAIVEVLEKSD